MRRLVGLALLLAACSTGGSSVVANSQMVGSAGGQVVSPDGKLTLTIPAGALPADTPITVREIASSELGPDFQSANVVAAYEFGPDGLVFQQPVAVALRLDQSPTGPGGTLKADAVILLSESGTDIEPADAQVLSGDADTGLTILTGEIRHFSRLAGVDAGFGMEIGGVPDSMSVYDSFTVNLNVHVNPGATASGDLTVEVLSYEPLLSPQQPLALDHTSIAPGDSFDVAHGPFECSSAGSGKFTAYAKVEAFQIVVGLDRIFLDTWEVSLAKSIKHEVEQQRLFDLAVAEAEAMFRLDHVPTGLFPNGVTVAGEGACAIVDTDTGKELEKLTTPGTTYGAVPLADDRAPVVFAFGSWGAWLYQWEVDTFGTPVPISTDNITDATPTPDGGLLFVDHTLDEVRFLQEQLDKYTVANAVMKLADIVSAVELPDGSILAVTAGDGTQLRGGSKLAATAANVGQLYVAADRQSPFVPVGEVGNALRRVRALGDVAAISSYGSGVGFGGVTIASRSGGTWSIGFALIGPSSVGIDLKQLGNGHIAVAATSFKTNEYRIIEVEPDGTYFADSLVALPAACKGPGHALWLPGDSNELAISCHDTSNLFVTPVATE